MVDRDASGPRAPGLGIDFGGVIATKTVGGEGHPSEPGSHGFAPLPRAFTTIHDLNARLQGRLWIVSKAGPATERMTREWLRQQGFADQTGVSVDRLIVVRDRAEKRRVCEELGITHFVDDQLKNLELLRGAVPHLYLFGTSTVAATVVSVKDWQELDQTLRDHIPDSAD